MKHLLRALLVIVLIVVAIGGVILYNQFDNVKAILDSTKYTTDELEEKLAENDERLEYYLNIGNGTDSADNPEQSDPDDTEINNTAVDSPQSCENNVPPSTDSTPSAKPDEASSTPSANTPGVAGTPSSTPSTVSVEDKLIGDCVTKMYALKSEFTGKLSELEQAVYKDYTSLPKEEQNTTGKKNIVMKYIDYVGNLEASCDTQVKDLTTQLEKDLKAINADTSIVAVINDTYKTEKELKKAYYLKKYNE